MTVQTEILAHGASFEIGGPGEFFQCHYATAELEFRVTAGGSRLAWVPLDRGIGWDHQWDKIEVRNTTGVQQTVTVVHHNVAGYFDQRELAAQVTVDGGVVTNTAPLTDDGGSISQYSASVFNALIDAVTPATQQRADIVTAAANVNGVRFRHLSMAILTATGTSYAWLDVAIPQHMYMVLKDGSEIYPREFEIGPGVNFRYTVPANMKAVIVAHYDLL